VVRLVADSLPASSRHRLKNLLMEILDGTPANVVEIRLQGAVFK
jgi:hypothetical protein